jgi:selenide,water dikinase
MLAPGQGARLALDAITLLPGAAAAAASGIRSTLDPDNRRACAPYLQGGVPAVPAAELLFDPQTSGGLLLGVAPADLDDLSSALSDAGVEAACIGEVIEGERVEFA